MPCNDFWLLDLSQKVSKIQIFNYPNSGFWPFWGYKYVKTIFNLAYHMRSMQMNGASKNRHWPDTKCLIYKLRRTRCFFLFLSVSVCIPRVCIPRVCIPTVCEFFDKFFWRIFFEEFFWRIFDEFFWLSLWWFFDQ